MRLTRNDQLIRTRETMQDAMNSLSAIRSGLAPLSEDVAHNQPPQIQWMRLRLDTLIRETAGSIQSIDEEIEHVNIEERLVKIQWNRELLENAFLLSAGKSSAAG